MKAIFSLSFPSEGIVWKNSFKSIRGHHLGNREEKEITDLREIKGWITLLIAFRFVTILYFSFFLKQQMQEKDKCWLLLKYAEHLIVFVPPVLKFTVSKLLKAVVSYILVCLLTILNIGLLVPLKYNQVLCFVLV